MLDDVTAFEIPPAVTHRLVQVPVHRLHHDRLAALVQRYPLIAEIEEIVLHLPAGKEVDRRLVAVDTERFDQVEDE